MPSLEDSGLMEVPNLLSLGNAAHAPWTAKWIFKNPLSQGAGFYLPGFQSFGNSPVRNRRSWFRIATSDTA